MELFLIIFGALFSVMNPLGTVPVFVALTQEHTEKERGLVAFKTALNVLLILVISFFLGKYILIFFGISINALKIAGGLIIASSGFALLKGEFAKHKGMRKKNVQKDLASRTDIALTPLALPMIAGPGTISLLITYNQTYSGLNNILIILAAVVASAIVIYITLKSSYYIKRMLGASGINALSRIIGFIVIAIGIQFLISAITSLISVWFNS